MVLTSQNPCFFAGVISRGSGSGKREARGLVETRRRFRLNVRPRGGAVARNRNPASARLRAPVPPVGVAAPASSSFLLNRIHIYILFTLPIINAQSSLSATCQYWHKARLPKG